MAVRRLNSCILGFALIAALVNTRGAWGAPINHGTFVGATVKFVDVTEDSVTDPVPLFGPPVVSGDTLDFSPVSFGSTSTGANGVDITDGALTMMIEALANQAIDEIHFQEQGDFTLLGLGGIGTLASVTAEFFVDILSVDGVGINPVKLQGSMAFSPSGGNWNLLDDGPGPLVHGTWKGNVILDVRQALINAGVPFTIGATKVTVTLDNTLATLSEQGTQAFIAKKDFSGIKITVPEPAAILPAGLGLCALILIGRARRRAHGAPLLDRGGKGLAE